ncbi:MAG: hypothetical protein CL610_15815 [Anaerolineaceae bacterium]|nr:hypothetical protein [Anaerolineaceae bacterium]
MKRQPVLTMVLLNVVLVIGIRSASAHAHLSRSDPPANGSIDKSPSEIRLWFTEPLEPEFSRITLRDSSGSIVDTPSSQVDTVDRTQMFMQPANLSDGSYTVVWRVLSTDGHSTEGSFSFGINIDVMSATTQTTVDETIPIGSAIIRWANLLSMSMAVGSIAFWLFVWIPAIPNGQVVIEHRMRILIWSGWILLGVTSIMLLLLQAATAADVPLFTVITNPVLNNILNNSRYGQVWFARQICWIMLGGVLWFAREDPALYWVALLLGGQILLTNSLYSHASAVQQEATAAIAGDWLHLTATALWIGGLAQFFNVIGPVRTHFASSTQILSSLVGHFSNFIRVVVVGLIISGIYSAWLQVGSIDGVLTTAYGQTLLLKVMLVFPLLAVAVINLVLTQRGLRCGKPVWIGRLRGLIGAELALATGILAAVGVMTAIAPARTVIATRNAENSSLADESFFEMQVQDNLMAHLEISPGYVGENKFVVSLFDAEGNPLTDTTFVRLRFDNLQQNLGQSELRPEQQEVGNIYTAGGSNMSVPGEWRIRMTVQRPNEFDKVIDYQVEINPPPPPSDPNIAMNSPDLERFLALFIAGIAFLASGGFFVAQASPHWFRRTSMIPAVLLIVGVIFLISSLPE